MRFIFEQKGTGMITLGRSSAAPGTALARIVGSVLVVFACALLLAASAMAEGAPVFKHEQEIFKREFSTRATIAQEFYSGNLPTNWKAEYAPAEPNSQAPPESSSAWKLVNEGEVPTVGEGSKRKVEETFLLIMGFENSIGPTHGDLNTYLRHLAPETSYYARFTATNQEGSAKELIPFKTTPLDKPEIPLFGDIGTPPAILGFWFREGFNVASPATSKEFDAEIESNGTETSYSLEYALPEEGHAPSTGSSLWKVFQTAGSGTITPAQEYAWVEAVATGLTPETTYYVRLRAHNKVGELVQTTYSGGSSSPESLSTFTTSTAKPSTFLGAGSIRNVTAASAYVVGQVAPHGSKTAWRFEMASSASGPWSPVPGGAGVISQAVAEATPYYSAESVGVRLTGLKPSTSYYVRLMAENECSGGKVGCGSAAPSRVEHFETGGPPSVSTLSTYALHGEALRLLGTVNPNSVATTSEQVIAIEGAPTGGSFTLTFKGETTGPIPYDASAETLYHALRSLSSVTSGTAVSGPAGGPYTVYLGGGNAETAEPVIEADGLGLAPPGIVSVTVTQQGGEAYDTHYSFQYVSEAAYKENGWAGASQTPEMDAGSGDSSEYVGVDLPGLTAGESYRYRLVAHSTAPGTGLVEGAEESLTVPVAPAVSGGGACPNEALRTGRAAHLPDCRGYEMLTPVDKEGAQEPLHYHGGVRSEFVVGEDGEHGLFDAPGVNWGGAGAGLSPYLFSRGQDGAWSMLAGTPQPEASLYSYEPQLYSADLEDVALKLEYVTSVVNTSPSFEFKLGRVGGPYQTIASVPRADSNGEGFEEGWVAGNSDLSKVVLTTADHTLLEEPTGTKSGLDLYEYTASGGLRQLNVSGEPAVTIGSCGASMAFGYETSPHRESGVHSISADGSRVFFEAVPGRDCSQPAHLYMRVNGESTVDIGAYKFAGANAQGTSVLLRQGSEWFLYDTETAAVKHLFDLAPSTASVIALPTLSEDFTDLYVVTEIGSAAGQYGLYRYDLSSETLSFIDNVVGEKYVASNPGQLRSYSQTTPDGRYYYFEGSAGGVPGSGVMRYDSSANAIECISCASSFDSEPKLPAFIDGIEGVPDLRGGFPVYRAGSANGDFEFFTTPAALVPQDIDGEIPVEALGGEGNSEHISTGSATSPSSDIYEWRKDGVDGCGVPQGCLALLTDGRGAGGYSVLLGAAHEGRDVFIYTRSQLIPQDNDTSGDVYDVRIGGGTAPPSARPVECEGDACSSPPGAPNDSTPSSLTFTGPGNIAPVGSGNAVGRSKPKPKKRHVKHRRMKHKRKKGSGRKGGRSTHRAGRAVAGVRSGRTK